MDPADRDARIEELLRFVGLWDKKDTPVEHLSGGMRRRLLIARGLMHRPEVVFMDEPTVGLDPQARRMIWGLIESLKRSKITILLTTHYIEEADALCDRVAIMRAGKIIALDKPAVLKAPRRQVRPRVHREARCAATVLSNAGRSDRCQPRHVHGYHAAGCHA